VPNISIEIQKKMFQDCNIAIDFCDKKLNSLSEKLFTTIRKLEDFQTSELKKRLKIISVSIFISIFASGLLTYCLVQNFPKMVNVDTKGNITIEGGNVSVWGMGKSNVQAGKNK
jgi:hypothetical protein